MRFETPGVIGVVVKSLKSYQKILNSNLSITSKSDQVSREIMCLRKFSTDLNFGTKFYGLVFHKTSGLVWMFGHCVLHRLQRL